MIVTIELPDDIAQALASHGEDLSRRAMEGLAVAGYQQESLSQRQVGQLLGLSRIETEDFLARHTDLYAYDPNELQREAEALEAYGQRSSR
jgi:predicted HTH domain antitoxin